MKARSLLAAGAVVAVLSGSDAQAHHGATGQYDASRPIVLAGTVTRAAFSPPHPVLSVRVETTMPPAGNLGRPDEFRGPFVVRPEDIGQVREVEFAPAQIFYDLGDRVRVGDRVIVIALRNCLTPHQLRSSWIQLSDGQVVSRTGGLHRKVEGCL